MSMSRVWSRVRGDPNPPELPPAPAGLVGKEAGEKRAVGSPRALRGPEPVEGLTRFEVEPLGRCLAAGKGWQEARSWEFAVCHALGVLVDLTSRSRRKVALHRGRGLGRAVGRWNMWWLWDQLSRFNPALGRLRPQFSPAEWGPGHLAAWLRVTCLTSDAPEQHLPQES